MKKEIKNEYGLITLLSTVIGTVIGSGIFFKSEEILNITNGNVLLGLLAFIVGGGVMLLCAAAFAVLSVERGSEGGVVGYAEKMCGNGYARFVALFSADFYLPSMTATLAYVSGEYFCRIVELEDAPALKIAVSGAFLIIFFAANTLSPSAARGFQICATALKLLPLLAIGAAGCVLLCVGNGGDISLQPSSGGFVSALLSAAFAYEGWIAVTALGENVKDPKKNMPLALVVGSVTVIFVYVFYYLGVIGASGGGSSSVAFENLFGKIGSRIMLAFVTVSCLGALNGLSMSVVRGHYTLSGCLNQKENVYKLFGEVSEKTGIPTMSGIMGLLVSELWLVYIAVSKMLKDKNLFAIDPAEASISVMYAIYLPIFIMMAVRLKNVSPVKRYALPIAAAISAVFVTASAPISFGYPMFIFAFAVAAVSAVVLSFYRR